jgi:hypothetical protein
MVSTARHLHTPPKLRTEAEVAADAIVAILDARIVPFTPGTIGRLSMATGVPVAMIKKAWESKEAGYGGLRPTRRPIADQRSEPPAPVTPVTPPAPVRKPAKPQGAAAHRNATRTAAVHPEPGKRRCATCKLVKPLEEFGWRNRAKGQRCSFCHDCYKSYQRERYLSVGKTKRLATLLRFVVCEEDHLELDCITCHLPIEAGQEVVADDVKLCHASCSAE